ncbi:MAG: DUF3768 domain-containing protein [Nitratireductor sp.]|uniref:DUF3768 domain-containing protein n=1 Tax=Alphaproteobacteria TaxID=28211 RepID=UPI00328428E8
MTGTIPADVLAIRELNDKLRQTRIGGRVYLSQGIAALGDLSITEILALVATFDEFTAENDPYGEHDCAIVNWQGQRVLFKIDYFDPTLQSHSDDPTDPKVTIRVMTVMFASEY